MFTSSSVLASMAIPAWTIIDAATPVVFLVQQLLLLSFLFFRPKSTEAENSIAV